jgi:excisionase family DNA binding protein
MGEKYLTFQQIGEAVGLKRTALYAELRSGRLRSYRPGPGHRNYRVTQTHIDDYLRRCTSVREEEFAQQTQDLHRRPDQHWRSAS